MTMIKEILESKRKPKEKISLLANKVKKNNKFLEQLVEYFAVGSVVDKGNCVEVMEYVSKDKPEVVLSHINFIIEHINDDAPKVKWETARVIGNFAQKYSRKIEKAIPKLLINTNDGSTVVRWSSAFALTEIAKYNSERQKELISKFKSIVQAEQNNGVKNVYLKALKILEEKKR